jgi:hypothetical protein
MDDFRDNKLKINDDRKVVINLNKFEDKVAMALLFIDHNETNQADYERATFRVLAEDTNQTID